jgi:hypothetical protein
MIEERSLSTNNLRQALVFSLVHQVLKEEKSFVLFFSGMQRLD